MNFFKNLNEAIDYLENNLFEEKLDLKKASMILGTSESGFKNVFSLVAGYTVKDYIKFRKLSECIKLLHSQMVVDVASFCGYTSRAAFSRAFKAFHGFNPSEFNENSEFNYFHRFLIIGGENSPDNISAKIRKLGKLTLYGREFECDSFINIKNCWKEVEFDLNFKNDERTYGLVYKKKNGKFLYIIALEAPINESYKKIKIEPATYLSTTCGSSKDISRLGRSIRSKTIYSHPDIEIYSGEKVELLYKI